jgi:acetyl-CoA carboxylase biotin carboxyl carrier protein
VPLSFKEIADIIRLIDTSSCDEFVIELDDLRLAVRRKSAGTAPADTSFDSRPSAQSGSAKTTTRVRSPVVSGAPEAEGQVTESADKTPAMSEHAGGLIEVRSPMTGIFYRKPAPDAKPFVSVGTQVSKGDPLCMIEVMKLFTTLHAERSGRIVEIPVADAQLVQHDQLLFLIQPA